MSQQGTQEPRVYEFTLFAELHQFYIQDADVEEDIPAYWDANSRDALLMVGDRIIGVGTARELDVPVTVSIIAKEPEDEDLSQWDHVTECSLNLPSGKLVVTSPTETIYEANKIDVTPGNYAVRVYHADLDDVDHEGFEGGDFYRVVLWPSPPVEPRVLKQYVPPRAMEDSDKDDI